MKIGKAVACCKNERWKDNTEVTARQTRRRDNQKPRWTWMDGVELDKYVGVKRRRKKALDRREWASIVKEAKVRCKGQYCQRIRRRSGSRRREFKRHIICLKSPGYFNRAFWLKPRKLRTKHDFPILSVGNAFKFELKFFLPGYSQGLCEYWKWYKRF
jgi:hypothetical protein